MKKEKMEELQSKINVLLYEQCMVAPRATGNVFELTVPLYTKEFMESWTQLFDTINGFVNIAGNYIIINYNEENKFDIKLSEIDIKDIEDCEEKYIIDLDNLVVYSKLLDVVNKFRQEHDIVKLYINYKFFLNKDILQINIYQDAIFKLFKSIEISMKDLSVEDINKLIKKELDKVFISEIERLNSINFELENYKVVKKVALLIAIDIIKNLDNKDLLFPNLYAKSNSKVFHYDVSNEDFFFIDWTELEKLTITCLDMLGYAVLNTGKLIK